MDEDWDADRVRGDDLSRMLAEIAEDPAARRAAADQETRDDLFVELSRSRGSLSQAEVARRMRTTQSAVSDLERGAVDPRLSTVFKHARAVGRRLRLELVDGEPSAEVAAIREERAIGSIYTRTRVLTTLVRQVETVGPQSPAQLAESTGLPAAAVEHSVSLLEDDGWVTEVPTPPSETPRFRVQEDRGLAVGVSVRGDRLHAVLTTTRATVALVRRTVPLSSNHPDEVIDRIVTVVEELVGREREDQDVIALGVSLAGLIDASAGNVLFAPDLMSAEHPWQNVPLGDRIEKRVGLPALIENDANTLAMHEYLLGGEEQNVAAVLLNPGGGVGGGIVVNGGLVHGAGGIGGEIGHIPVVGHTQPCRCSDTARGCLETVASAGSIVRDVAARAGVAVASLAEAAALVESGNRAAQDVFRAAGDALGLVLSVKVSILSPHRLVLYGPPELADERRASARLFLRAVRGQQATIALDVQNTLFAEVVDEYVEPLAAAATAAATGLYRVLSHRARRPA